MAQTPKTTTAQTPAAVSADVAAFLAMYKGMSPGQKASLTKSIPGKDGKTIQQKAAARAAATRIANGGGVKRAKATPEMALPAALLNHLGMSAPKAADPKAVKPDVAAALAILKRIQASK